MPDPSTLIDRYLGGSASPEEIAALDALLRADPGRRTPSPTWRGPIRRWRITRAAAAEDAAWAAIVRRSANADGGGISRESRAAAHGGAGCMGAGRRRRSRQPGFSSRGTGFGLRPARSGRRGWIGR
ncbi:MAG: hypothetical protein R3F11_13015 [Verrucomicrobiales bacterium]